MPVAIFEHLIWVDYVAKWQSIMALFLIILGFVIRLWAIQARGKFWTFRCLAFPGMPIVKKGPFRFLKHPEYVSRAIDGAGLFLFLGAELVTLLYLLTSLSFYLKITGKNVINAVLNFFIKVKR
jgi:methyltransferase